MNAQHVQTLNFPTSTRILNFDLPPKKMPDDLRTSTRCAMDCAIKAREKPKALEMVSRRVKASRRGQIPTWV